MVLFLALASTSPATINIDWFTLGQIIDPTTGMPVADGSMAQLIWSPDDCVDPLDVNNPTVPQGNDILLDTAFTGFGRVIEGSVVYDATAPMWNLPDDTFVSGFVYTRIFNMAAPTPGPTLAWIDPTVPGTQGPVGSLQDRDPPIPNPPDQDDLTGGFNRTMVLGSPEDQDSDSDGFADFEEAIADTDPLDSDDFLWLSLSNTMDQTVFQLTFPSSPNRQYRIEWTEDLVNGPWNPALSNIPGTGGLIPNSLTSLVD
ncbi:MAG: hypothetical protein AAF492_28125, partial [Verrucomicrobiota bacterium]